ncbi:MAG: DUF3800 domain-containing protein [Dehalococcoidia bacterium]
MVFAVYLDDSGWPRGSPSVVLAGYVATCDQWKAFTAEWQRAISEFGLPYFHMSDFAGRHGVYRTWTTEECETRFQRLAGIINACATCSVAVILPVLEYAAAMGTDRDAIPGDAYGFAAICLTFRLPKLMIDHHYDSDPQLAYFLDTGAYRAGEIASAMTKAISKWRLRKTVRFNSVTLAQKEGFVPLQAADILAWQWHYHARYEDTSIRKQVPYSKHLEMVMTRHAHLLRLKEADIRNATVGAKAFIIPQLLAKRKINRQGGR